MGYDKDYFAEVAFVIAEGSDFDEVCQQITDEIAEKMGITNPDPEFCNWENTEYGLLNELVNEMVLGEMG